MKLGYAIVYVDSVKTALDFYNKAFGLKTRFLDETGNYGELDTGQATLAFAAHALAGSHLPSGYVPMSASGKPLGMELALVTDDVASAFAQATAAGAAAVAEPKVKPWGQTVAYVRSIEGTLIELCTPIV